MRRRRKSTVSRIDSEIRPLLKRAGRFQRNVHPEIWARWSDIVGEDLARRALPRAYFRKTLVIAVASSAWLQQLTFLKAHLLERFHEEIGPDVVKEIKLNLDARLTVEYRETPEEPQPPPRRPPKGPIDPELREAICKIEDRDVRESIERAIRAEPDKGNS